jgi:hypothetical protein
MAPLGFHRSIEEQTGFDTDPDLRPHGLPLQGSLSLRDGASFAEHRLQPALGKEPPPPLRFFGARRLPATVSTLLHARYGVSIAEGSVSLGLFRGARHRPS